MSIVKPLVREYTFEVWHDKGRVKVTTTATSLQEAKSQVAAYEGCPESAIRLIGGRTL